MKKNFVLLCNLLDITDEHETAKEKARWKANVMLTVGEEGYTLDTNGDDYTVVQFSADEVEFADVDCYNFMGSAYEDERFYSADWTVVREKATGDLYALETDDIYEF